MTAIEITLHQGALPPGTAGLQTGSWSAAVHSGVGTALRHDAGLEAGTPGAGLETSGPEAGAAGAVVVFDGIVRRQEDGRPLLALDYEAYEPMASRTLERLARGLAAKHTQGKAQILAVRVLHSVGRVPVGMCSFRLEVASAHRKEALAFMDEFIDEMKKQVPIWKNPVWADTHA